eukprot:CAMPEP_0178513694 /NCGR_PEP_ID=MMETSP0696-20121128/23618_1 /TAXON_ID=265572 /ORGANISM="Extubocellulus spinifer, Strain CCMP396" /LENGTH=221 /DNA_ID=CAMNT_0020143723 /DNA_START=152 /DNA_END=816 /DNA_ORIENTATION=+
MATSAILWFSGDVLAAIGDVLAQILEHSYEYDDDSVGKKKTVVADANQQQKEDTTPNNAMTMQIDWKRVRIQAYYAALIWAPFGHYWYEWLDRAAHKLASGGSIRRFVGSKLILEMALLHPIGLLAFFACVGLMGGDTPCDVMHQLRKDFFPSLILEYVLWLPFDMANFAFIPVKHQLLVVNSVCLLESIMLSYIKANGISIPGHEDTREDCNGKKKKKNE